MCVAYSYGKYDFGLLASLPHFLVGLNIASLNILSAKNP